jgi:hypothetical protein
MRTLPPLRQHAALGLVAAIAAGLALTIAPRPTQTARLTIAVEGPAPVAEVQRLLESEPVAAATIRNLRLAGTEPAGLRRRLHVRAQPAALDVSFADRSQAQAQRSVQELALVLSQSVHERYRGRAVASISAPVRPAGAAARPWARNLLLAALAGLALAALTTLVTPLASRPARARCQTTEVGYHESLGTHEPRKD